ncbi:MAG: acyltransferase [Marinilabiliaceae bacterium]|nr:acyltransferase [Marinilabiliaceae bacterium]
MSAINLKIGQNVIIHPSTEYNNVEFGDNIKIAKECTVIGSENHKVKIGSGSIVCMYSIIDASQADIILENNVTIAQQNVIISHWNVSESSKLYKLFRYREAPIKIKENTWIGSSCIIAPGVTIGRCSIIAANSYVDRDVPDYSIYGGNPAKLVRNISPKDFE